ncbi:MAG: FAD-dependent monooxygenase, partial [Thermocrispum sp.]
MKVGIVGAGPSGLYLAILLARSNPRHEITVYERNAPDATFGWGVVFSEETLGTLRDADGETYLRITDTFARWDAVDISYRGEVVRCRGHAFSAIARKRLLAILQQRAAGLGVKLNFGREIAGVGDVTDLDVDLVVGADGVRSVVRAADEASFRPDIGPQGCKYVWFGTDLVFDAFRFIFAESEHGLFQVHAYPFDEDTSTFIVECREETWRAAGLDTMSERQSIAFCQQLFAAELGGHRLMSNKSDWLDFPRIRTRSWHTTLGDTPAVLLGDAAHTAHFTIGSGTKLAMEDAVALANALSVADDVRAALVRYEQERQPVVERFQEAAADSADYFTRVRHHTHLEPPQFAVNLLT